MLWRKSKELLQRQIGNADDPHGDCRAHPRKLRKAQRYYEDCCKAQEDEDTDPPDFDAKCDALVPVIKGELKAHFHCHRADDIFTAIRLAKEFDLDYVWYTAPRVT